MPDKDDLLDPSEIEALLKSAGSLGPKPPVSPPAAPPVQPSNDVLNPTEIEALLRQRDGANPAAPGSGAGPEELLDRAQQGLAAAMGGGGSAPKFASPTPGPPKPKPPPDPRVSTARPFSFQSLDDITADAHPKSLEALEEVELDLRIELGRTELLIEEVLKLREGSVVPLDKLAGDPVDILVNGRLVARGEVLVLNDNFCVRVAEILSPQMP